MDQFLTLEKAKIGPVFKLYSTYLYMCIYVCMYVCMYGCMHFESHIQGTKHEKNMRKYGRKVSISPLLGGLQSNSWQIENCNFECNQLLRNYILLEFWDAIVIRQVFLRVSRRKCFNSGESTGPWI